MRTASEETTRVLPELIKRLKEKVMTLDEIRLLTGWQSYRCIMQHIDAIGDNYPIWSPAKNQYKILTEEDYVNYA